MEGERYIYPVGTGIISPLSFLIKYGGHHDKYGVDDKKNVIAALTDATVDRIQTDAH